MPTRAPPWAPPLLAAQLLTRLPVPGLAGLDPNEASDGLSRSVAWMPLVGTLIGLVTAGVFALAARIWPPAVAAGLALAAEALLTGAFHEDAIADFCDAFGGRATGDEARRIMRDSRIGSYGALGLLLLVGLRWTATAALPPGVAIVTIVAAATIGRAIPAALLALVPPLPDGGGMGARVGASSGRTVLLALLLALPGAAPLAMVDPIATIVAIAAALLLVAWLARAVRHRIGGSTGDCLGAAAYLGQLAVLLAAAAR